MTHATLLTGRPGSGKTTLVRRVLEHYHGPAGGFFTRELRPGDVRQGFEIVTLDGAVGTLAHVELRGPQRIGKYGVDLDAIDRLAVASINKAVDTGVLVVIDEIGPMEILSPRFREAVLHALDSRVPVLGTIALRSTPFTDAIRRRSDVFILQVTRENRDSLVESILSQLKDQA